MPIWTKAVRWRVGLSLVGLLVSAGGCRSGPPAPGMPVDAAPAVDGGIRPWDTDDPATLVMEPQPFASGVGTTTPIELSFLYGSLVTRAEVEAGVRIVDLAGEPVATTASWSERVIQDFVPRVVQQVLRLTPVSPWKGDGVYRVEIKRSGLFKPRSVSVGNHTLPAVNDQLAVPFCIGNHPRLVWARMTVNVDKNGQQTNLAQIVLQFSEPMPDASVFKGFSASTVKGRIAGQWLLTSRSKQQFTFRVTDPVPADATVTLRLDGLATEGGAPLEEWGPGGGGKLAGPFTLVFDLAKLLLPRSGWALWMASI